MRRNSFIEALVRQCETACPTTRNTAPTCRAPPLYAPTLAPTTSPTFAPSPRPTQAIFNNIAVTLSFILEGVSTASWASNESLYDPVMVRAIVNTISHSAINADQVGVASFGSSSSPSRRRRLDDSSSGIDYVKVNADVRANDVRGLTDASTISTVDDAVADGSFTDNLHEAARFYGASALLDVTVVSMSGSGDEGTSRDHRKAMSSEMIGAIVVAVLLVFVIATVLYMYIQGTVKRNRHESQQIDASWRGTTSSPLRLDQAPMQVVEPTQNPLHGDGDGDQGRDRVPHPSTASVKETGGDSATKYYGTL